MRKISKSRGDDDVISSTNGSVSNEVGEQPDTEATVGDKNEEEAEPDPVANENGDNNDEPTAEPVKKPKKKVKGRPKKIKSSKKSKNVENEDEDDNEEEEEYEVDKIVDSKKIKGRLHYLIRWKGYSAESDTWEPENTLSCPELINKFNEKGPSKKENATKAKSSLKRKGRPSKGNKPAAKKSKVNSEWDSENADENAEYEVDRIMEVHHKKNGKREFLIHWKGWSSKFDSWEPESNLNCTDLIKKFMDKVSVARSSDSKSLRVNPGTTNRFTLQDPTSGRRLSKRRGQSQRVRYDNAE